MRSALAPILLALLLAPAAASAQQDTSVEGRLRDALRRQTIELRAAQDGQVALQAQLDQARQQVTTLQKQLDDARANAAAAPAAPPPPDPELETLRQQVATLTAQAKEAQAGAQKAQAAYQQAAGLARERDAQAQAQAARAKAAEAKIPVLVQENAALVREATDILHLYRTQSFRTLLLGSYEPVLGFKQVELQNMVQDYEDRILAHQHVDGTAPGAPAR